MLDDVGMSNFPLILKEALMGQSICSQLGLYAISRKCDVSLFAILHVLAMSLPEIENKLILFVHAHDLTKPCR